MVKELADQVLNQYQNLYQWLSIKVPSSKKFTGDGEDLKPEVFDRWYNSVQLYLRLHNVSQNAAG